MERILGYLCIDEFDKVLVDSEKQHYWIYINGEEYYFKPTRHAYNEIIAYYGAKYFGIDACYYDLAMLNNEKGVISKSLRNPKIKLVSGDCILDNYLKKSYDELEKIGFSNKNLSEDVMCDDINNLEVIYNALLCKYGNKIDIESVMNEFVLMYLFDILFCNVDRHAGNWMLLESCNDIKLAPLLDNELILKYDVFSGDVALKVNFNDSYSTSGESLRVFLNVYPLEYFKLIEERFLLVAENFIKIMNLVEEQIGSKMPLEIRNNLVSKFYINYSDLSKIMNDFKKTNLIKKKLRKKK